MVTPARPDLALRGILGGMWPAVALLTRVPVSGASGHASAWTPAWFPVVGAAIGAVAAGTWWLASPLGALPAAVLAVGTTILLTGALHEDGLADTADALGGATSREAIFDILKDSRVGTYGAVALVLSILLRVSLLVSLSGAAPTSLVLAHAVARLGPTWLLILLPYVTPARVAKNADVARTAFACGIAATLGVALVTLVVVFGRAATATAATAAVGAGIASVALLGWYFHARAGGVTGDFLGATEQVGECVVLLVLAAAGSPSASDA